MNDPVAPRCSSNLWCPCKECEAYWAAMAALEKQPQGTDSYDYEAEKEQDRTFEINGW